MTSTVTLSEEVYRRLRSYGKASESDEDIVLRLCSLADEHVLQLYLQEDDSALRAQLRSR